VAMGASFRPPSRSSTMPDPKTVHALPSPSSTTTRKRLPPHRSHEYGVSHHRDMNGPLYDGMGRGDPVAGIQRA
jgi:hypothetical protein